MSPHEEEDAGSLPASSLLVSYVHSFFSRYLAHQAIYLLAATPSSLTLSAFDRLFSHVFRAGQAAPIPSTSVNGAIRTVFNYPARTTTSHQWAVACQNDLVEKAPPPQSPPVRQALAARLSFRYQVSVWVVEAQVWIVYRCTRLRTSQLPHQLSIRKRLVSPFDLCLASVRLNRVKYSRTNFSCRGQRTE